MRSTIIILVSALSLLEVCCSKYKAAPDDLGGQNYIRGRVFFADTLDYDLSALNLPATYLPGVTVHVSYADSNNFIYSVSADVNGYFTFANLQNTKYWVYADTTLDSTVYYSGYAPATLNNSSPDTIALTIYPSQTMQNGALYIVKDTSRVGFITGVNVCFFSSPAVFRQVASADSLVDSCTGCNYSAITNGAGRAYQLNMAPGFYNVLLTYQIAGSMRSATDTITIGPLGIVEHKIYFNLQ
jgi:hypothetical protein